ncbi:hypothetical protein ACCP84_10855 [Xanthomonas axonopodis pv. ricini]
MKFISGLVIHGAKISSMSINLPLAVGVMHLGASPVTGVTPVTPVTLDYK